MFPVGDEGVTCARAPPPEKTMAAMLTTAAHRRTNAPEPSVSARRVGPRNRSTRGRTCCDIGAVGAFKRRRIQVIGMPDDRRRMPPASRPSGNAKRARGSRCCAPTGRGFPDGIDRVAPSAAATSCATPSSGPCRAWRHQNQNREGTTKRRPPPPETEALQASTPLFHRNLLAMTFRADMNGALRKEASQSVDFRIGATACPAAPSSPIPAGGSASPSTGPSAERRGDRTTAGLRPLHGGGMRLRSASSPR